MFVDQCKVKVRGGKGGNGCTSFRREKYVPLGGPSGGDGGNGGDVIFRAVTGQQSLVDLYYLPHYEGGNAGHGKGKDQYGPNGKPRLVDVPQGTIIKDYETGEVLADLCEIGQEFVAARGGHGGRGNRHFATPQNRAPRICEEGKAGDEHVYQLELKTVADIGLVGYPNAGKSTLIGAISNAHPKTAAYPFTTLHPVVGLVEFPDFYRFTMADIPGLIDGAHQNIGLGHDFLRHIERCRILVYVIDTAGVDQRQPEEDLEALRRELDLYKDGLSARARLIVANKMDLPEAETHLAKLKKATRLPVLPVSALEHEHLRKLLNTLRKLLEAETPGEKPVTGDAAPAPAPAPVTSET